MTQADQRNTWSRLSQEISGAIEGVGRSVVAIEAGHQHASSGIVWRADTVVTADHTVRRAGEVTVVLEGGQTVPATLAGRDPSTDLAVFKVATPSNLPVAVAAEPHFKVGGYVVAVGRTRRGNLVASSGILSGVMGAWRTWRGGDLDHFLRPDLTMYPGFSGSALIDPSAQVLGLNTTALRRGSCITISASTLDRVVDELLAKGRIPRPYLGLAMQPVRLPESQRSKLNLTNQAGLLVVHVEPSGPADQAGVIVGDIVIAFAGGTPERLFDLQEQLHGKRIGDQVDVSILRGGTRTSVVLTVGERPTR